MNNGLIEYKESFISKVKKFLKNLFARNKHQYIQENSNDNMIEENKFFNDVKINSSENNKVAEKRKFLEAIDGNRETLSLLSIDRLEKLEQYYDKIIKENDEKIKKLKENA